LSFHACINEIHGSRRKIPSKKSRPYIYDVKFPALLGAPYIYDISTLRVIKEVGAPKAAKQITLFTKTAQWPKAPASPEREFCTLDDRRK
jgi:hypothetical protein